jgi:hypothetical protein
MYRLPGSSSGTWLKKDRKGSIIDYQPWNPGEILINGRIVKQ